MKLSLHFLPVDKTAGAFLGHAFTPSHKPLQVTYMKSMHLDSKLQAWSLLSSLDLQHPLSIPESRKSNNEYDSDSNSTKHARLKQAEAA